MIKNVKTLPLPTRSAENKKKSWMTSSLFTDFFTSLDKPFDENAEKRYKANVLDALYFVRQSWD